MSVWPKASIMQQTPAEVYDALLGRRISVGPLDALTDVPSALLTRSLAAAEYVRGALGLELGKARDQLLYLQVLCVCFQFNRDGLDRFHAGDICVVRAKTRLPERAGPAYVRLYDSLALAPECCTGSKGHSASSIFLGSEVAYWSHQTGENPGWQPVPEARKVRAEIRRLIHQGRAPKPLQTLVVGDVPDRTALLVDAAYGVVYNSPYNRTAASRSRHKWRFQLIGLVSEPESGPSVRRFSEFVKHYPRALSVPGWCGGIPLHPICRLGNIRMLEQFLQHAAVPTDQESQRYRFGDLLNWRNVDGCTPLHTAVAYGQQRAAGVLVRAGADSSIPNRFGQVVVLQDGHYILTVAE